MKTPREILSERHQAAMPKLDAVRTAVLQNELGQGKPPVAARPSRAARLANLPLLFWYELIFPCRRAWVGLAAAWLLIGAANVTLRGHSPTVMASVSPAPPPLMTWRQQERVLSELMGWGGMPADRPPKSFSPQPSSWRRIEIAMT
jgi:hypothetical protein